MSNAKKDDDFRLAIESDRKRKIRIAAAMEGVSMAEFVRKASARAAEEVIRRNHEPETNRATA